VEVEINWKAVNNNSRLGNDKADKVSRDWEVGLVTAIELNNKASKAAFDNRNALAADPTGNFNTISPCDLEL